MSDVLSRMVRQGNRLRDVTAMTPARALRLALSRLADDLWDLAVVSRGIQQERLDQESALSVLGPDDLILVLDAADGAVALAALDRAVVSALIEVQTVGTVFDRPPEQRRYTGTDAAMAWIYLDPVLRALAQDLADHPLGRHCAGYRFDHRAADTRSAGLVLTAAEYHVMTAELGIAGDARSGEVRLVLPLRAPPAPPPRQRVPSDGGGSSGLGLLPTEVRVLLPPLHLSLARACALKPGDLLDLPDDVLDRARVLAAGGHPVATARLGQLGGFRAVRLALPARIGAEPGPESPAPGAVSLSPGAVVPDSPADFGMTDGAQPTPAGEQDNAAGQPEDDDLPVATLDLPDLPDLEDLGALEDFPDWEEEGESG